MHLLKTSCLNILTLGKIKISTHICGNRQWGSTWYMSSYIASHLFLLHTLRNIPQYKYHMYYFNNDQRLTIMEVETIFVLLYLYHLDNLKALPTALSFLKLYFSKYRDLLWRIEHLLAVISPFIYFSFVLSVWVLGMCLSTMWMQCLQKPEKASDPPKWSYRHLWATMWAHSPLKEQ